MLSAGIKTPVPLDEVESHLRDDVEQQMRSGLSAQHAFEAANQHIGRGDVLKKEFAKTCSFFGGFGDNKATGTNRILGVLWFAQCLWFLIRIASSPAVGQIFVYFPYMWKALVVFTTMYSAGVFGSILLFRGAKLGRNIIRIIAVLDFILCVSQDRSFALLRDWAGMLCVFNLVTLWLLRSPSGKSRKMPAE